jgi:tetratricopeptide (TPR) repeat protein
MSGPLPYHPAADYDHAERLARGGEARAGLRTARVALEAAREAGDAPMVRRGLNAIAVCQNASGRFIEAIAAATDAYSQSIAAHDVREATNALATLIGMTGFLYPLPDSGLPLLDECLVNALRIGDKTIEARIRMFRAMRLGGVGRFAEGEAEFATLMRLSGEHDIKMPSSMLALNWLALAIRAAIAKDNLHDEAWDIALTRYAEALDHSRQEHNPLAEMRAEANLVDIEFRRGNAVAAVAALQRCLAIGTHFQQHHVLADLHFMLAQHLDTREVDNKARAAYLDAYNCAELSLPNRLAADSAGHLARIAQSSGDESAAAHWRERERDHRAAFERERDHAKRELEVFFNERPRLGAGAVTA